MTLILAQCCSFTVLQQIRQLSLCSPFFPLFSCCFFLSSLVCQPCLSVLSLFVVHSLSRACIPVLLRTRKDAPFFRTIIGYNGHTGKISCFVPGYTHTVYKYSSVLSVRLDMIQLSSLVGGTTNLRRGGQLTVGKTHLGGAFKGLTHYLRTP